MKRLITIFSILFVLSTFCFVSACNQHKHEYTQTVTQPTCTEKGYTTNKCSCGDVFINNYVDQTSHSFTNYVYNDDATCSKDGTETASCDNGCGATDTKDKVGTKLEHVYTNYVYNDNATCFKDGTETASCDRNCGTTDTKDKVGTKLEHVYTNYVYNNDATCKKDGTETAKCDRNCGTTDTKDKVGTKLEHVYENYVYDNNETCFKDGTETASCKFDCGTTDTKDKVGSAKHIFTEYVYDNNATCFKNGTETAKCDRNCGTTDTKDKVGTKFEHVYTKYTYNDDATCFKDGTETAKCDRNCGTTDTKDKVGSKLEHVYTKYESDNNATYESDGTKTAFCDHGCGTKDTVTDEGSMLIRNEIIFTTLKVEGTNVSGQVESSVTEVSFADEIEISGTASYVVDDDIDFSSPIVDGKVTLEVGDNVFYVKEYADGKDTIYTVTINREKPTYKVTFITKDGTSIASQQIEHGSLAQQPDDPTRTGFDFTGWDFDFSTPITSDTVITASWKIKDNAVVCEVYAKYGDGQPLAGVAVKLYNATSGTGKEIALGETNEEGVYTFVVENVDLKQCAVKLGDYGITNGKYDDYKNAVPSGFELITPSVTLNGATEATLWFADLRNQFYHDAIIRLPYSRYMDENGEIITNGTPLELVFDGEVNYKYITFEPFRLYNEDDENAEENAKKAANGVYRIYFDTLLSGVELKYFAGSAGYVSLDSNGIPNGIYSSSGFAPEGYEGSIIYYGSNYIELDLNSNNSRGSFYMYVYSKNAGEVTLTAEWMYASRDVEYIFETIEIVDGLTKFEEQEGELTLMPITGAYDAVFNSKDGFYHVGSVNGPLLVVQLNKAEERISDSAITDIPAALDSQLGAGAGRGYFTVNIRSDDGYTVHQYDFYNAILGYTENGVTVNGYKQLANKDGVFPVNEQLKLFLENKSFRSSHEAADGYKWLVACMYYAPEGGLDLAGNGTESNPYKIIESDANTIKMLSELNGVAYMEFVADVNRFYSFALTGTGTLTIVGENVTNYTHNGVLYAELFSGVTYKLKLTATENCVISIGQISEKHAEYQVVVNEDGSSTDQSTGREASNALSISGVGAYVFVLDSSQGPDGVYYKPTSLPIGTLNYKLTLYGPDGVIKIKTASSSEFTEGNTVSVKKGSEPTILITTDLVDGKIQEGNYLLIIENA